MSLGTVTPPLGKNTPGRRSDCLPRGLRDWRGERFSGSSSPLLFYERFDVRYWPKADIPSCTAHVRSWG
jgi:hypothetical protein